MFDKDYLESLPDNPLDAGRTLCTDFFRYHKETQEDGPNTDDDVFDNYLAAFGAAQGLCESNKLTLEAPTLPADRSDAVTQILSYIRSLEQLLDSEFAALTVSTHKDMLKERFAKCFHYEFSSGDMSHARELINELRELVSKSELFEEGHRSRLLLKLEKIQSELHKRVSDLDKFWGLIGDAGVVQGKFGNDAKPFFDRIRDLTQLVWATQSRGEGLPSSCPFPLSLPSADSTESQVPPIPSIEV